MHPKLAEFPSLAFYEGRVGSDPTPESRPLPLGLDWPSRRGAVPLAFVVGLALCTTLFCSKNTS
jgi:hypothetical protein